MVIDNMATRMDIYVLEKLEGATRIVSYSRVKPCLAIRHPSRGLRTSCHIRSAAVQPHPTYGDVGISSQKFGSTLVLAAGTSY